MTSLVQKYSPDQPRVPASNTDGGQWTSGANTASVGAPTNTFPTIRLAANLPCDGFVGGCQSGGTYGTNAMYRIGRKNLCRECAVNVLGIENEPSDEKVLTLSPFSIQGK